MRKLRPDDSNVALRMTETPVRELGNRTLEEVVAAGETDEALHYLQAITSGRGQSPAHRWNVGGQHQGQGTKTPPSS